MKPNAKRKHSAELPSLIVVVKAIARPRDEDFQRLHLRERERERARESEREPTPSTPLNMRRRLFRGRLVRDEPNGFHYDPGHQSGAHFRDGRVEEGTGEHDTAQDQHGGQCKEVVHENEHQGLDVPKSATSDNQEHPVDHGKGWRSSVEHVVRVDQVRAPGKCAQEISSAPADDDQEVEDSPDGPI